ncbi:hypothetical protein RBI13_18950 [Alcaligenaceae bacterium A4P071]|nr:hypothetical protein [Alcaligenaceae bacterium A4P071]
MTRAPPAPRSGRYRLAIFSRVLAAVVGGYALSALISTALTLLLVSAIGVSRANSVLIASMLSFAIYAGVAVWVFAIKRLAAVWAMQATIGCGCLVVVYLLNGFQPA